MTEKELRKKAITLRKKQEKLRARLGEVEAAFRAAQYDLYMVEMQCDHKFDESHFCKICGMFSQ